MKDFAVTIRIETHINAKNEEEAQERAERLAEAYTPIFKTPTGKPAAVPSWVGDQDEIAVDNVEDTES